MTDITPAQQGPTLDAGSYKGADMGQRTPGAWRVRTTVRQSDGTMAVQEFAAVMDVPPEPPAVPRASYFDDDDTRRVARELPRFVRQQQQLCSSADRDGPMLPAVGPPPPALSGKARAREEIFVRRAQLVSELSKLGMSPMIDCSSPGTGSLQA